MKQSTLHRLRKHPRFIYTFGMSQRARTRSLRRRSWRTHSLVALIVSGLLLSVGVVLGRVAPSQEAHSALPQVVQHTRVVLVRDDTLPPVMQRIAQCESRGQHFTKEGKVVRGRRNSHDTGLFQINAVVWAKKAKELGYDIRTLEGNEQMARYLFENYGSGPWQSSAKCWRRIS